MLRSLLILSIVACIARGALAADVAEERAILAAITRAAEGRAEAGRSVRIMLLSDVWYSVGGFGQPPFEQKEADPDRRLKGEYHYRTKTTLSFDGDRLRIHEDGEIPSARTGGLVPYERYHIVDGSRYAFMQPPTATTRYWVVDTCDTNIYSNLEVPRPVAYHLRMRHPDISPDSRTVWGVAEEREKIGKSECVVVAVGDGKSTYAFDPARDWIVRRRQRIEKTADGEERMATETVVEYTDPSEGDPRPVSWISRRRNDGKLRSETRVKVIEWAIRPEWKEGTFDIRYPKRSLVHEVTRSPDNPRKGIALHLAIDAEGERHEMTEQEYDAGRWKELLGVE